MLIYVIIDNVNVLTKDLSGNDNNNQIMEEAEEPELESEIWTWAHNAEQYYVVDMLYSFEDESYKVRLVSKSDEFLIVPYDALESWFVPHQEVEEPEQPAYS